MHDYFTISTVHYSAVTYIIHLTNGKKEITKGVALSLGQKERVFEPQKRPTFWFCILPLISTFGNFQ